MVRLEFPAVKLQIFCVQAVLELVEFDEPSFTKRNSEMFPAEVPETWHLARMRVPKFLSQDEVGCAFQAIFTSSRAHHKQLTKQNQKHSHTENEFSARVRVYATLLFCSMKSV